MSGNNKTTAATFATLLGVLVNSRPPPPEPEDAPQIVEMSHDVRRQAPVVSDHFHVKKQVGKGGFGEVYKGLNIFTGEEVAMKYERKSLDRAPFLREESEVLQALQGGAGFPKWMYFGEVNNYRVLVTQLLGPSLIDLYNAHNGFSMKTILMIGDKLLSRLEHIHGRNYMHRDLKPENILVGLGPEKNEIYLIDFGLAKRYRDPQSLRHIPEIRRHIGMVGTPRYASVKHHQGFECSRKDDKESLVYVLMFFAKGNLPWQCLEGNGNYQLNNGVLEKKNNTPITQLCQGLPTVFQILLSYSRELGFSETPDYALLHKLIRAAMDKLGINYDNCFDWSSKRDVLKDLK